MGGNSRGIHPSEDRRLFRAAMEEIGLDVARSGFAYSLDEGRVALGEIGLPAVIRASFTLGGGGPGVPRTREAFERNGAEGLAASATSEVLIQEAIAGWTGDAAAGVRCPK